MPALPHCTSDIAERIRVETQSIQSHVCCLLSLASTHHILDTQEEFVGQSLELDSMLHAVSTVVKAVEDVVHEEENADLSRGIAL